MDDGRTLFESNRHCLRLSQWCRLTISLRSKTPLARLTLNPPYIHQDRLATLPALIQEVFVLMNEDLPATIVWFRTPARVLDWTSPRDLILRGDFPKVCNLVSEVHRSLSL